MKIHFLLDAHKKCKFQVLLSFASIQLISIHIKSRDSSGAAFSNEHNISWKRSFCCLSHFLPTFAHCEKHISFVHFQNAVNWRNMCHVHITLERALNTTYLIGFFLSGTTLAYSHGSGPLYAGPWSFFRKFIHFGHIFASIYDSLHIKSITRWIMDHDGVCIKAMMSNEFDFGEFCLVMNVERSELNRFAGASGHKKRFSTESIFS